MRTVATWGLLVLATCISWVLGSHHDGHPGAANAATAVTLAIGFGKAHLVGSEFMELRHAPSALRLLFAAWILLVGGTLIGLYVLS